LGDTEVIVKFSGDAFHGDDVREDRVDLREDGKEQLAMERWRPGFKKIQSETTVRENMGRTFWWLGDMEVMVKFSGDAFHGEGRSSGFERG
jgi:hypothetical protein